jgi:DNA mismatch repair protein MutL
VALEQAYGGLLAKNCYPAAVLLLALPAGFVDVNVHPTKQEVRFADENRLFSLVRNAVEEGLRVHNLTPGAVIDHIPWKTTLRETAASAEQTPVVQNLFVSSDRSVRQGPPVQVFGQLQGKYILAQGESGLLLVDQHAAHERVYFERLIHHADLLHRQELLLPLTYEASAEERAFAAEQEEELQCLGFVIEPFGGNTLLVRAVPSVLADGFGVMDLRFLLDHLLAADQDAPSGPMPRRLVHLALAACKAAIKARTGVTKQEAGALLVQLWECRNPYTCPHGRPTMIELSIAELDRRFGRR